MTQEFVSTNPATLEVLGHFPGHGPQFVEAAIARSQKAFESFRRTSFAERKKILFACADILENEKEGWGTLMALEMGKTKKSGMEEAAKCALGCRYYAEHGEGMLADEVLTKSPFRFVSYAPLGPVLAIMPWNFPFWQVFRFLAPALMAGNTALLKHASNVPQCALAIEEILRRAGAPEGVFQTLLIGASDVARVISDERVRAVTLTGSEGAGAEVAALAGKHLKKVVLELGGSDPFIVMPTCDLPKTIETAIKARTINSGQSCVAAKRFIVHADIADEFEKGFVSGMASLKVGDPLDLTTEIGPLANESILEGIEDQVKCADAAGAKILTGGSRLDRTGFYFAPTVVSGLSPRDPLAHEEFFGPVALLFRASNFEEALKIANDNPFGLGASLWSRDPDEQARFAREIEAGMAFVNSQVVSDPALPFGGIKRSGHGRELASFGIREFTNVKTVVISS